MRLISKQAVDLTSGIKVQHSVYSLNEESESGFSGVFV